MNEQEFFNLAYSKGYNFDIMNKSILQKIKSVVEYHFDVEDIAEKSRVEPLPTARKIYTKIASEMYRGKVKNVVAVIGKNHASFSTDLKAANGFLEVDKDFIADYHAVKHLLAGDENEPLVKTTNYIKNMNVISPEVC